MISTANNIYGNNQGSASGTANGIGMDKPVKKPDSKGKFRRSIT